MDTQKTPTPAAKKRSAAAQERLDQIVSAAVRLINARGFNGMSLQAVADEVGITQAGVLHYVGSKHGLLVEVIRRYYDRSSTLDDYLSLFHPGGAFEGQSPKIPEYCRLLVAENNSQPELVMRLAQMGLRVALAKGKWSLYVVNSPMHQELRKLFAGTKWATGGWSLVLRRLPGGEESTQRIGAGLGAAKVTVVDVPEHLLLAGNEDDMLLAA